MQVRSAHDGSQVFSSRWFLLSAQVRWISPAFHFRRVGDALVQSGAAHVGQWAWQTVSEFTTRLGAFVSGRGQEPRTSQKSPGFLPRWHPLQPPLRTEADWLSSSFLFGPMSLMYPEAPHSTSEDDIIVLICIRLGISKLLFFSYVP